MKGGGGEEKLKWPRIDSSPFPSISNILLRVSVPRFFYLWFGWEEKDQSRILNFVLRRGGGKGETGKKKGP